MSPKSIARSEKDSKSLKTCDSKLLDEIFQNSQSQLQQQLSALRQMTDALAKYQRECIEKIDLVNAKETRIRIKLIQLKEGELLRKIVQYLDDKKALTVRRQSQDAIQTFDIRWNQYFSSVLAGLAEAQKEMKASHIVERKLLADKYESLKSSFKPSIKLSNLKKKIIGLMKLHLYQEAQVQAKDASDLEKYQIKLWSQKMQTKMVNALKILANKQNKEIETLRYKNENLLTKKMKERDRNFEILVKKYQIRQQELKKDAREMTKNSYPSLMSTKRLR